MTWLQDRNLLKGMNLRSGDSLSPEGNMDYGNDEDNSVDEDDNLQPIGGTLSPTSDYADSTSSGGGRGQSPVPPAAAGAGINRRRQQVILSHSIGGTPSLPIMTRLKLQQPSNQSQPTQVVGSHRPYDPQVHVHSKPPFSFSCLIFMAIEDSPKKALPVKEIYAWILDHFPYFKDAPTGWKNSVRHNLSLNKCFKKVEKAPNLGKGSLWMVDEIFRPNLLQALRKAPFQPHTQFERVSVITSRPQYSPSPPNEDYIVLSGAKSNHNVPNPELFPFLSRKLAAASGDPARNSIDASNRRRQRSIKEISSKRNLSNESIEDVDAAAAMLALKHGPHILFAPKDDWHGDGVSGGSKPIPGARAVLPVITSSPSEDHTYSAGQQIGSPMLSTPNSTNSGAIRDRLPIPSSSPDEAFSEGSLCSESDDSAIMQSSRCVSLKQEEECDLEEQRKIAEGADALLNLAGICTKERDGLCNQPILGTDRNIGMGVKAKKRMRASSPSDQLLRVKVRVEEKEEVSAVDRGNMFPKSPTQSGSESRFLRGKKSLSRSFGGSKVKSNHSSQTKAVSLNGNSKDKKKQGLARRMEDKIYKAKR
ncbi:hypothetical protein J437_LFUL003028 [Ladona fulva]|uniref:Forkhead box protein N3 n=1 Tax=Ladona fulva TaxID=123851 RepID=A0A8K0NXN0_LADFU|nr:hypothetical protein J437_LFUL003028 [Ladona fulva]